MGVEVEAQLLDGEGQRLKLRQAAVALLLVVDHAEIGEVQAGEEGAADQPLLDGVAGRVLVLKRNIGIGQRRAGRQGPEGIACLLVPGAGRVLRRVAEDRP